MASWNDTSRSTGERAAALLAEMTIEEKASQLGSVWARPPRQDEVGGEVAPMESVFSTSGLDQVAAGGLGHLTRIFGTEPVEVAEGVARLRAAQRRVVELNRFGIPAIAHEECLTGFTAFHATVYPAAIAWGATFDPELTGEMAQAIGEDMRAVGVHQGLSPVLDVVSDYGALPFLHLMHHVAGDLAEAGRMALTAGLDIELPQSVAYLRLASEVREGRLDEALLDRAVLRVLEQKVRFGLLGPDWDPEAQGDPSRDIDSPRNRDIARRVAEASVVLLANDGILPLEAPTVALIGPVAGEPRSFMGCYAFPNHVLSRYADRGSGLDVASLVDGMAAEWPSSRIITTPGVPFLTEDRSQLDAAVEAARQADVAVVAVGDLAGMFGTGTSGEGCDSED